MDNKTVCVPCQHNSSYFDLPFRYLSSAKLIVKIGRVKACFPLKEHLINPFLRGEYTVDTDFQQLVEKGKKTQQEVETMIQLASEVQYAVLTKRLGPGDFFSLKSSSVS